MGGATGSQHMQLWQVRQTVASNVFNTLAALAGRDLGKYSRQD
jgi:hypothetical protein